VLAEASAIRSGNMMEAVSAIFLWHLKGPKEFSRSALGLVGIQLEPACVKCIA
jgi:hypothetical protein